SALSRHTHTSLSSRANQTNVTILNSAIEPSEPSFPRVYRNLLVGLIAGLALGLNLAIVVEILDRRVRSGADLSDELALPMLGSGARGRGRAVRGRLLPRALHRGEAVGGPAPPPP